MNLWLVGAVMLPLLMGANDFAPREIPPGENARVRFQKLIDVRAYRSRRWNRPPFEGVRTAVSRLSGGTARSF
jgi:hypothetical protein